MTWVDTETSLPLKQHLEKTFQEGKQTLFGCKSWQPHSPDFAEMLLIRFIYSTVENPTYPRTINSPISRKGTAKSNGQDTIWIRRYLTVKSLRGELNKNKHHHQHQQTEKSFASGFQCSPPRVLSAWTPCLGLSRQWSGRSLGHQEEWPGTATTEENLASGKEGPPDTWWVLVWLCLLGTKIQMQYFSLKFLRYLGKKEFTPIWCKRDWQRNSDISKLPA